MAYNTRSIKKDVDGRPVPQYFNSTADDYEPLLGENGAARSVLYGPNGQPLSVIDNKLAVRAADLETLIGALNDSAVTNPANAASVIAALKGLLSVVGKEATLGQILLALGSLATESTLASLASSVAKEATLSGVKSAVDTLAGTVSDGAAKVTLSGRNVEILTPINALALTDTTRRPFQIDVSKYRRVFIYAFHTHDQPVRVEIRTDGADRVNRVWMDAQWQVDDYFVMEASDPYMYLANTKLTWLNDMVMGRLLIIVRAHDVPTTGAITLRIAGVPN